MEPLEVSTKPENPEYPTKVTILDFKGDYEDPDYTFQVQVQIEYNHVVGGEEENLLTFTFWTEEDTCWCHGEDEEGGSTMDENDVEEWFEEGLSEDLSFYNLEGLENLDLYAGGIPFEIVEGDEWETEKDICSLIESEGISIDDYDCEFGDDYIVEEEEEETDYTDEIEYVIEELINIQNNIIKKVEEDPDDEYDKDVSDLLGQWYYAFGIMYGEGKYYICFGSICGQELDYYNEGEESETPFTKEMIRQYVEDAYYQMLSE